MSDEPKWDSSYKPAYDITLRCEVRKRDEQEPLQFKARMQIADVALRLPQDARLASQIKHEWDALCEQLRQVMQEGGGLPTLTP